MNVPCITLYQPWASAIALGLKPVETRPRRTHIRGTIGIHAGLRQDLKCHFAFWDLHDSFAAFRNAFEKATYYGDADLPRGCIICLADIVDCVPSTEYASGNRVLDSLQMALGDFRPGRWAWVLDNVRRLNYSIPTSGHQGWFNVKIPDAALPVNSVNSVKTPSSASPRLCVSALKP
jgi:hypothetical protein